MWLTDGSAEGAPADPETTEPAREPATEPAPGDAAEDADPRPADVMAPGDPADVTLPVSAADMTPPADSYAAAGQDAPHPGLQTSRDGQDVKHAAQQSADGGSAGGSQDGHGGIRIPPYQPPAPPYPGQVPPSPPAGAASKVAAPFAAITRPMAKIKKPVPQGEPADTGPGQAPGIADRAAPAARPAPRPAPPARRAQLVLSRIEPWSVMKFSFMISLVGWVILFVAAAALYFVLSGLGVFHSIQSTITDVTSSKGSAGTDANGQWFSASRILGYTMLIGAVNVVLITALATVGAMIYNLVTRLASGVEVTLKETD